MPNCTSCGSTIPEGQGKSCSMCCGDINHGNDGYYREWAEREEQKQRDREEEERLAEEHAMNEDSHPTTP